MCGTHAHEHKHMHEGLHTDKHILIGKINVLISLQQKGVHQIFSEQTPCAKIGNIVWAKGKMTYMLWLHVGVFVLRESARVLNLLSQKFFFNSLSWHNFFSFFKKNHNFSFSLEMHTSTSCSC